MAPYLYQDGHETERLATRWLSMNDLEAWTAFFEDEDCVRYFPNPQLLSPATRAEQWIERQLKRYAESRYGLQALIDKSTNAFIGQCGLLLQEVDGQQELEVGYHVFKQYWGLGYAPEAATFFKTHALQNRLAPSVISIIHKDNLKSQRVAAKNGMSLEKYSTWMDMDVCIYRTQ